MLKRQALDAHVLDKLARVRIPLESQQFGQRRRRRLDLCHVLARERAVMKPPGATVEIPFAGRIARLGGILDEVPLLRIPGQRAEHGGADEGHDPPLGIDRRDANPRGVPRVENDHLDVVQMRPGLDVGAEEPEAIDAVVPGRLGLEIDQAFDAEVSVVRRAGADGPAAVDKQLAKVPPAGFDVGQIGEPRPVAAALPAGDDAGTAEHRRFAGCRSPDDRRRRGSRVARGEHQRLIEPVRPVDGDGDRPAIAGIGEQLAHHPLAPVDRGERPVTAVGLGRWEPAGPLVVATGTDMQFDAGANWPSSEQHCDADEQEPAHRGRPDRNADTTRVSHERWTPVGR